MRNDLLKDCTRKIRRRLQLSLGAGHRIVMDLRLQPQDAGDLRELESELDNLLGMVNELKDSLIPTLNTTRFLIEKASDETPK